PISISSVLFEPPYADPHVRWCERAEGATPHPTRSALASLVLLTVGTTPALSNPGSGASPQSAELEELYQRAEFLSYTQPAEAFSLFRSLAERGHAKAQRKLGVMYVSGQGVDRNLHEAAKWYRRAADQGEAEAQNALGELYASGGGVPQDYGQAVYWFRKAAVQGLPEAQYNLAAMYAKGHGVPRDDEAARSWCSKAGGQGYAEKLFGVRSILDRIPGETDAEYEKFRQVLASLVVHGYRQAAEMGHSSAQAALAAAYYLGFGAPVDDVLAYMWANLAAAELSGDERERAVKIREAASKRMARSEIAEAQRLSQEWRRCTNFPKLQ
ncbi:MAG: tetratricopeptide repeat protein, partial [Gammaproteobacteria bacterium]